MKLFIVFLLAACVLWFVSDNSQDSSAGLARAIEVEAVEPDGSETFTLPENELLIAQQTKREAVGADEQVEAAGQTSVVSTPANTRIRGTVVIREPSGLLTGGLQGSLKVLLWKGNSGKHLSADIHNGTFELDANDAEYLTVTEVSLLNQGAMIIDQGERYEPGADSAVIVVTRPKAMYLSVVSTEDGMHLSDITVTRSTGWSRGGAKHPGRVTASNTVLTKGTSPLALHPPGNDIRRNNAKYFVYSPGYAWQAVQLNLVEGGEREVRLLPGGDLEVRINGDARKREAQLSLHLASDPGGEPYLQVPAFGKELIQLGALVPGSYNVSIRIGKWYDDPLVLGEQPVQVVAGETGIVELILAPPVENVLARFAGVLILPEEWEIADFRLSAKLKGRAADGSEGTYKKSSGDMSKSAREKDAWLFDFGDVATGTYTLEIRSRSYPSELEYGMLVVVEPGTAGAVRLEVPPPANVLVHLEDGTSGEAAKISSIHWGPFDKNRTLSMSLVNVSPRESDGAFEFRAPVGSIGLGAFGGEYTSLYENVDIHAGQNEFTFTVHRNCPLEIVFMDGETPVPVEGNFYPSPEHLGGEGKLLFTTSGQAGFKTALSEPGSYVFPASDFPKFTGFEPIPDQTITVVRGKDTTYQIHLVRSE